MKNAWFYMQNKKKKEKEKLPKMKMKNATHRNLIGIKMKVVRICSQIFFFFIKET